MAERVEKVTQVEQPATENTTTTRQVSETSVSGSTLAARIIWYLTGVLLVLLAFRFVLTLLGANANNGFANFIYTASHPFVSPFFSLFHYQLQYGISRFEIYTLVAMGVYAVIGYGLAKLFTLGHPVRRDVV
jgi:hypothetical protein